IRAMRVDHVFDAVCDEVAGRQRIEHAVMPHGDAVIDGDSVELSRDAAAGSPDRLADDPSDAIQMDMCWNKLGETVRHRDDWFTEVGGLDAARAVEGAHAGGQTSFC